MTSQAGKTRHYVVGSKEVDGKQSFNDIDQIENEDLKDFLVEHAQIIEN